MPDTLRRITCEYVAGEDRLRISGALDDGRVVVIWATNRLLNRFLPHLARWLVDHSGDFRSKSCTSSLVPAADSQDQKLISEELPPAAVVAAEADVSWLALEVDIAMSDRGVGLTFRSQNDEQVSLNLYVGMIRQWLAILHSQFELAGWDAGYWGKLMEGLPTVRHQSSNMTVH